MCKRNSDHPSTIRLNALLLKMFSLVFETLQPQNYIGMTNLIMINLIVHWNLSKVDTIGPRNSVCFKETLSITFYSLHQSIHSNDKYPSYRTVRFMPYPL